MAEREATVAEKVKVRRPTPEEGARLLRIVRRGHKYKATTYRRALVILGSAGGNNVKDLGSVTPAYGRAWAFPLLGATRKDKPPLEVRWRRLTASEVRNPPEDSFCCLMSKIEEARWFTQRR